MPTPPSDDTKMMFKILADGQWHLYEAVRDEIASKVPPGRALRKYEERVESMRKYKDDPTYDTEASEDERIFYGARACAQIVITSWKGRGVMFIGDGPEKQIRIKPGFKSWGIDVEGEENADIVPPGHLEEPEGEGPPEVPVDDSEPPAPEQEPQDEPPIDMGFLSLPEPIQAEAEGAVADQSNRLAGNIPASHYSWSPYVVEGKVQERCPECSLLVVDREKHAVWHERHVLREDAQSQQVSADSAESVITTLMDDLIVLRLNEFQAGMQEWMQNQFAQLEAAIRLQNRPGWKWPGPRS